MNDPAEKLSRVQAPPPRPVARLAAKRAALEEFARAQAARAPEPATGTEDFKGWWSRLRPSRTKHGGTGLWSVSRAAFGSVASACVVTFSIAVLWPMFAGQRELPMPSVSAVQEPLAPMVPEPRDAGARQNRREEPEARHARIEKSPSPVMTMREVPLPREAQPAPQPRAQPVTRGAEESSMAAAKPSNPEADEIQVTAARNVRQVPQNSVSPVAGVVDSISSEDLGAVADQDVEASLQRVPGVQAPLDKASAKVQSAGRGQGLAVSGRLGYAQRLPAAPPGGADKAGGGDRFRHFDGNAIKPVTWGDNVSTFSVDVDTASYSFARRLLMAGGLPPQDSVRVEEMINYFDYAWPVPESRQAPFEPTVVVSDSPWTPGKKLVHIGIKGYEMKRGEVPDANLVLLLDVSGSMNSPDKLPLAVQSMELLLDSLKPTDTVAIVVYAGAAGQVLAPTPVRDKEKILDALRSLRPGGSTAGAAGIQLAYQLAEQSFRKGGVNRVMLATDGDFNVGIDDPDELKGFIERKREKGIFLSVLGFGQGNYRDELAQVLAQNGNGVAAYIDTLNEAKKVLVNEATGSLFTIAKDVKIQVEFNPQTVAEYRLVGYETRALKNEDFNNDKVDAGDVGAGHTVTALYEITPLGSAAVSVDPPRYSQPEPTRVERGSRREYGFVKIRYKLPTENVSDLITQPIPLRTPDVPAAVQREVMFSTAVAGFGQLLRGGTYTGELSYEDIIEAAQNARGDDRHGYRAEFVELVRRAQAAQGR